MATAAFNQEITDPHLLRERLSVDRWLVAMRSKHVGRADQRVFAHNVTMSDAATTAERNEALSILRDVA